MFILENTIGQNLRAMVGAIHEGLKRRQQEREGTRSAGGTTASNNAQQTKQSTPAIVLTEAAKLLQAVVKTGHVGIIQVVAGAYLLQLYKQGREVEEQANLSPKARTNFTVADHASTQGVKQGLLQKAVDEIGRLVNGEKYAGFSKSSRRAVVGILHAFLEGVLP